MHIQRPSVKTPLRRWHVSMLSLQWAFTNLPPSLTLCQKLEYVIVFLLEFKLICNLTDKILRGRTGGAGQHSARLAFMDQNFFRNKENLYHSNHIQYSALQIKKSSLPWGLQKRPIMTLQGYNRNMSAGKSPIVQIFISKMVGYFQPENKRFPQILLPNCPSTNILQIFTTTCSYICIVCTKHGKQISV